MISRKVAIAVPASNEAERIVACLRGLTSQRCTSSIASIGIFVLANNCSDETASIVRAQFPGGRVHVREVSLIPPCNHAGWARRLAIEFAARSLSAPTDILASTDADTIVSRDWLQRTVDHIDRGCDAVAGFVMLDTAEWRNLHPDHKNRFNRLRKYFTLLAYLRGGHDAHDPWPRHESECGASIALTMESLSRIGELPAPAVGEDKALFEAVKRGGGLVRHPLDVQVFTSCRYEGRAPGGTADTFSRWSGQPDDAPIHGARPLNVELGLVAASRERPLTFGELDREIEKARLLIRSRRFGQRASISA